MKGDFIRRELERYLQQVGWETQPARLVACAGDTLQQLLCARDAALYLYHGGHPMEVRPMEDGSCRMVPVHQDWSGLPERCRPSLATEPGTNQSYICLPLGDRWDAPGFWCVRGLAVPPNDHMLAAAMQVCGHLCLQLQSAMARMAAPREKRLEKEDLLARDSLALMGQMLKGPLAGTLGGVQLLQQRLAVPGVPGSGQYGTLLTMMEKNLCEALRLISNLMEVGRLESNPRPDAPVLLPIRPWMREVANAVQPYARAMGCTLRLRGVQGANFQMYTARGELERIVLNLLGNALLYAPPEGGCVTLSVQRQDDWVLFTVTDNGPGLREEDLPHLFEKYWHRPVPPANRMGAGLGLYIAAGLAGRLGGTLTAENAPGGGARFLLHLPLRSAEPLPEGGVLRAPAAARYDTGELYTAVRLEMAPMDRWPGEPEEGAGKSD